MEKNHPLFFYFIFYLPALGVNYSGFWGTISSIICILQIIEGKELQEYS